MTWSFFFVLNLTIFLFCFLNNVVHCIQKHGCELPNEDFFLANRSLVPKFGKPSTVVKFDSEEKLKQFIEDANKIYHAVVGGNIFNSFDPFLKFYQDSKDTVAKNPRRIVDFYVNYQYKYRPKENGLSSAIEILDRVLSLKNKYPEVEHKGFLASCPSAFTDEDIGNILEPSNETKVMKAHSGRPINALAAYKIQVKEKIVYVLFHTAYYMEGPIVLVKDLPNDPLNTHKLQSRTAKYEFRAFKEYSEDFIFVSVYLKKKSDVIYSYELIYTGQSYCSFMDTTDKRALVHSLKTLLKRRNVQEISGLKIDLDDIGRDRMPVLCTYLNSKFDENGKTKNVEKIKIETNSSGPFDQNFTANIKERLTKIAQELGYKYEELIGKLTLLKEILADHVFVKTVLEFDTILYHNDPDKIDLYAKFLREENGHVVIGE